MVAVVELRERKAPLLIGGVWMLGMSVLLFFLPVVNTLVGGLIGGYKVGSVTRALETVVLAVIATSFVFVLIYGVMELPVFFPRGRMSTVALIALADVVLIASAAAGGALGNYLKSERRPHKQPVVQTRKPSDVVQSDIDPPILQ